MINVSKGWNERQKNLMTFLKNQKTFVKGKNLLLEMHGLLHNKKVYKTTAETFYDIDMVIGFLGKEKHIGPYYDADNKTPNSSLK